MDWLFTRTAAFCLEFMNDAFWLVLMYVILKWAWEADAECSQCAYGANRRRCSFKHINFLSNWSFYNDQFIIGKFSSVSNILQNKSGMQAIVFYALLLSRTSMCKDKNALISANMLAVITRTVICDLCRRIKQRNILLF